MDELYDAFGAAASRDEELPAERRALLVEVIGAAAARRRRRRVAVQSVGAVGAAAVAVAGIGLTSGLWGGESSAQPAAASDLPSVAPPSSPSPSPGATGSEQAAQDPWELVTEGWFLTHFGAGALGEVGYLALIGPDGATYDVGDVASFEGAVGAAAIEDGDAVLAAWWGEHEWAFSGDGAAVITAPAGALVNARESAGGTRVSVQMRGVEEPRDLCTTGDDFGDALLTLDGSAVLCFEPVSDALTSVTLYPLSGDEAPTELATFEFPASSYARLGWTSDTTLLFGRELEKGYRYFSFDLETGELDDVFLPGDLDGWVPRYDLATDTYTVTRPGHAEFYDGRGELIIGIQCLDSLAPEPRVWISGTSAFVACAGSGTSDGLPEVIDLRSGEAHLVTPPRANPRDLVAAIPYPAYAGA